MPQKGVVEKTEETMGEFLWMPEVATPFYDILKSLLQTAKFIGSLLAAGFLFFIYISMVMDLRKTPYPWSISLVGPLVLIFVGTSVLLLIIIGIGFVFSPIKLFGYTILSSYPYTCPPTHPELNGLLCYKPCPSGRHRVSDVCWADTQENGIGTPVGLEPCPDGWNNWGLICNHVEYAGGWFPIIKTVGRLDHGGVCPGPEDAGGLPGFDDWYRRWKAAFDKKPRTKKKCLEPTGAHDGERSCDEQKLVENAVHTERVDGLCYKPCPSGMTHVPGMPYLCVKQESNGKPMRLDYYDADSKIPSMIQLFGFINPF
jgi:hypothetical protein